MRAEGVFVHISGVQKAGLASIEEGDRLEYGLEPDRGSGRVSAVDLVLSRRTTPPRRSKRRGPARPQPGSDARLASGPGTGVVRWFNAAKGFGFISPHDGGADVYVHVSIVERAGLTVLDDGQPFVYERKADQHSGKISAVKLRRL